MTISNAASLGFGFNVSAPGTLDDAEIPSVFSIPGTHTVIQIPPGQPSGVYRIKADATNATKDSAILATYFSSSTTKVAATVDSAHHKIGDSVILSGLVFDGATPITNASVTAAISSPVLVSAQTSIGNYQLAGQQIVSTDVTDYSYTATLTNTGAALQGVTAQLMNTPRDNGVSVLTNVLVFGDVPANSTVTSVNTVIIARNPLCQHS